MSSVREERPEYVVEVAAWAIAVKTVRARSPEEAGELAVAGCIPADVSELHDPIARRVVAIAGATAATSSELRARARETASKGLGRDGET